MRRFFTAWDLWEKRIIGPLAGTLFLISIVVANVEVIRRYLFNVSFHWSEDIVLYPMLMATFLCFDLALKEGQHLRITFVLTYLGKRLKRIFELFCDFVGCVVCILLALYGVTIVRKMITAWPTTLNAGIPFFIFYLILDIAWVLLAFSYLQDVYFLLKGIPRETSGGHR